MALPVIREHTDAVIAALTSAVPPVGDAQAPTGNPPYVVVYLVGGRTYGTLAARNDDAELIYQVTCVGSSRKEAEWRADKAKDTLLAGLAVTARSVPLVTFLGIPAIQREDVGTTTRYSAIPRFRVFSTPA
jgi:hypothetical protein